MIEWKEVELTEENFKIDGATLEDAFGDTYTVVGKNRAGRWVLCNNESEICFASEIFIRPTIEKQYILKIPIEVKDWFVVVWQTGGLFIMKDTSPNYPKTAQKMEGRDRAVLDILDIPFVCIRISPILDSEYEEVLA